jgi:Fe2+ transport system protein FeoA
MPLSMADTGRRMVVTAVRGGYGIRKRLADLGLNIGMDVTVVHADCGAPLLVELKGTRYAIGRGLAHHIFVEPAVLPVKS